MLVSAERRQCPSGATARPIAPATACHRVSTSDASSQEPSSCLWATRRWGYGRDRILAATKSITLPR